MHGLACAATLFAVAVVPPTFAFTPAHQLKLSRGGRQNVRMAALTATRLPRAPVPGPLLSNEPGTWAYDTMSRRVREEILGRLFEENKEELDGEAMKDAKAALEELYAELSEPATSQLRPIGGAGADVEEWNRILAPFVGMNWLDAPWCVTEFYLYRRIMEALDYFNSGFDPFAKQKARGLDTAFASVESLAPRVIAASQGGASDLSTGLRLMTAVSLWGNRMDLSLWPAGTEGNVADAFSQVLASSSANLLADDFDQLLAEASKALEAGGRRVDIVVDNAGFELVTDLCLADFLVSSGVAPEVVFQLKAHPTFVSDAMAKDLQQHIDAMGALDPVAFPGCVALAQRWAGFVASGAWKMHEDFFWVQPSAFWEIPSTLAADMASSALTFTKGDANYRRLLGDRAWATDTPFADVVSYFPSPLCALRTLKAELGCGMTPEQTKRAASEDDKWMVNGRYGVIHFAPAMVE